jgi:hypothetical protein
MAVEAGMLLKTGTKCFRKFCCQPGKISIKYDDVGIIGGAGTESIDIRLDCMYDSGSRAGTKAPVTRSPAVQDRFSW